MLMQAASVDLSAREARLKAAEEQLSTLRTQVGQQKAAADSRQALLETQFAELQVRHTAHDLGSAEVLPLKVLHLDPANAQLPPWHTLSC